MTYISGRITKNKFYKLDFSIAETYLKTISPNEIIINPVSIGEEIEKKIKNPTWIDYMREDLKKLVQCDSVFMLKGWRKSKGAKIEHYIAKKLAMNITYQ